MNKKSDLLSMTAFFDELALLDEGRARDDVHAEFSKAFAVSLKHPHRQTEEEQTKLHSEPSWSPPLVFYPGVNTA